MSDTLSENYSKLNKKYQELKKQLADKKREYKVLRILFDIVNNPEKDAMLQQIQSLQKQLEEKEQIIQMQQNMERYDIGEMLTENIKLRQQLHSQSAEIVEKIKEISIIDVEEYSNDPILYKITEEELDTILKEYQK